MMDRIRIGRTATLIAPWILVAFPVLVWLRAWRGLPALDHCRLIACDFQVFYAQAGLLFEEPLVILPNWLYPPAAALLFALFLPLPYGVAAAVWSVINLVLCAVLVGLCARALRSLGRGTGWAVALALTTLSLPVVHSVKWGQISLLLCVGVIVALLVRSSLAGGLLGLLAGLKIYPLAYLLAPLARRQWRTVTMTAASAIALGALVPMALLGAGPTATFFRNTLAASLRPSAGEWAAGYSSAWWGGQGIEPLLVRWFRDGGHVGLIERAPALWFSLPPSVVTAVSILLALGILVSTYRVLVYRNADRLHASALVLVAVTLVVRPAWHHYFAFLPFAQAVVVGDASASRWAKALAVSSWAVAAIPVVLLGDAPRLYYHYSQWGGTTVAALLVWVSLMLPLSGKPQ